MTITIITSDAQAKSLKRLAKSNYDMYADAASVLFHACESNIELLPDLMRCRELMHTWKTTYKTCVEYLETGITNPNFNTPVWKQPKATHIKTQSRQAPRSPQDQNTPLHPVLSGKSRIPVRESMQLTEKTLFLPVDPQKK